jgi:hypothetical protein
MNWLAMSPRLLVGRDGVGNRSLTWLLVAALLLPASAAAFEGSLSLELSGGNRTLAGSLIGDWGVSPERLYLLGSYGVVRQAGVPGMNGVPPLPASPTHVIGLGLDWTPSVHWMLSTTMSLSPKATDSTVLNPQSLLLPDVEVSASRRSLSAMLAVLYQSAGFDPLEWSLDATASGGLNTFDSTVRIGRQAPVTETTQLWVFKPSLGLTLSLFTDTDLAVRGTYSLYSGDPTTAGRFRVPEGCTFMGEPCGERLGRFTELTQLTSAALTRLDQVDALSGYASAPSWVEGRFSVLHRLSPRVSGQLSYTFVRYVPLQGYAHAVGTRWSFKLRGWMRLWFSVSVQYNEPVDRPSQRTSADDLPYWSGVGTLGGELSTQ